MLFYKRWRLRPVNKLTPISNQIGGKGKKMTMKEWMERQKVEALGEVNRYYFHEHYGRDANSDNELMMYYIEHGAEIFSELHRNESYCHNEEEGH